MARRHKVTRDMRRQARRAKTDPTAVARAGMAVPEPTAEQALERAYDDPDVSPERLAELELAAFRAQG